MKYPGPRASNAWRSASRRHYCRCLHEQRRLPHRCWPRKAGGDPPPTHWSRCRPAAGLPTTHNPRWNDRPLLRRGGPGDAPHPRPDARRKGAKTRAMALARQPLDEVAARDHESCGPTRRGRSWRGRPPPRPAGLVAVLRRADGRSSRESPGGSPRRRRDRHWPTPRRVADRAAAVIPGVDIWLESVNAFALLCASDVEHGVGASRARRTMMTTKPCSPGPGKPIGERSPPEEAWAGA